jgi:hypothetical protein
MLMELLDLESICAHPFTAESQIGQLEDTKRSKET